jgi:hypothetical protein
LGVTKIGSQAKPLTYFEKKVVFLINLEQMFKSSATDLDTQPITTQQRLKFALKNARLMPDDCCCLNNAGSKILFNIKWRRVHQGFNVAL